MVVVAAMTLHMLFSALPVRSQDEPVAPDRIPKSVMDALHARFPAALIDTCTKTREGRDIVYDIEFTQRGRKHEADITEKGRYINFESAIAPNGLPKTVHNTIQRRYPNASITEVMEETETRGKRDVISAYEIVLTTSGGKAVEVRISPKGKVLEESSIVK